MCETMSLSLHAIPEQGGSCSLAAWFFPANKHEIILSKSNDSL